MTWQRIAIVFVVLLNWSPPAFAEIWLKVQRYTTVASGRVDEHLEFLGAQIELGFVDGRNESIPMSQEESSGELAQFIETRDGQLLLRIGQYSYGLANVSLRRAMQERLMLRLGAVKAFFPFVDLERSCSSENSNLPSFCGPSFPSNQKVPVQLLLSSFARRWAGKSSGRNGPNCFYSAIAAINEGWVEPRFMSEKEFLFHLDESFVEVSELQKLGDTLVLFSEDGTPMHAATFVGQSELGEKILLTKNGKTEGFYLFMDIETVLESDFLYQKTLPKYYRLLKGIEDISICPKLPPRFSPQ